MKLKDIINKFDTTKLQNNLILIISLMIISAGVGYYVFYELNLRDQRSSVASMIRWEISKLSVDIEPYSDYKNYGVIATPIYGNNGLYYLYGRDMFIFDHKVNENLFIFYYNVIEFENSRNYMQLHCVNRGDVSNDTTCMGYHNGMVNESRVISNSSELLNRLNSYIINDSP
jgi:hypothetical protein